MALFDFFKRKQDPVVVKKTTTIVENTTTVIKKDTKKTEPEKVSELAICPPTECLNVAKYRNLLVCLDPGHAVSTPGKRSPYSACKVSPALDFYEYKFNREVCEKLAKKLRDMSIEVFITTNEKTDADIDVSLTTRATRAWNKIKSSKKPAVFISVHANANGKGSAWDSAKGWSVYTTKGNNISDKLAEYFYDEAEKMFTSEKLKIRTEKSDGDRDWEENFTVIYKTEQFSMKNGKPTVPAVLTENFFYSNIDDCKYLCSKQGIDDIVNLHLFAILDFADKEFKM